MNTGYLLGIKIATAPGTDVLAGAVADPFTPNSPAISTLGDELAEPIEMGTRQAVKENLTPTGQAGFKLLSGRFGEAFDLFTGNNQSANVKAGQ